MKAIETLRGYIKYRKSSGANMEAFDDALDEIEAYIHALEAYQINRQPERLLIAKMIIACFENLDFISYTIAQQSIKQLAFERANHWVDWDLHTLSIRDQIVADQAERIEVMAMQTVRDLIEWQEIHNPC